MGNISSISMPCAAMATRCWDDCIRRQAMYIYKLEENLVALEQALQQLTAKRDDVVTKVNIAEQQQLKRLNEVQLWVSSVEAVETEVAEMIKDGPQEVERLCLGGCCSKNCKSSYKFGKRVARKLENVIALKSGGDFKEVAERVPAGPVSIIPSEPTVGLDSISDKVWSSLQDEKVGIIGLYGIGGVGKTTLLKNTNNKLLNMPSNFVIWVVVSRELKLEKVQEDIGKKIGLFDGVWKSKSRDEKAADIFRVLTNKKFVLFLDDIWEWIDLTEVGIPLPYQNNGCKIVFTTRSFQVCGQMEADVKIKVECLAPDEAWKLFRKKVGEDTLNSHPKIPKLAEIVVKECDGLPLAIITVGRTMACKKTPEEWNFAIEILRRAASEFPGLGKKVYPRLKFSYDNLPNETVKSCFLYCSLFPEDFLICKDDLIDYWNCEGFLGEYDGRSEVRNLGYDIIGTLLNACLLEEEDDFVKMHDVVRDVTLWIACEGEKGEKNFLVRAGAQLTEAPGVEEWEGTRRVSLMANHIENLTEAPNCSGLLTLFLHQNRLKMIAGEFIQFLPSLRVLNLSRNWTLRELPLEISKLVSLEYLNLSETLIQQLPIESKTLVQLKYLNLENTWELKRIPHQLISSFSKLQALRMKHCGYPRKVASIESIRKECFELLVAELQYLKHLNTLTIDIGSESALQRFISAQELQSSVKTVSLNTLSISKQLNIWPLASMKHLEEINITRCRSLVELTFDSETVRKTRRNLKGPRETWFDSLRVVNVFSCNLRDLTWLVVYASNLTHLHVSNCSQMLWIINQDHSPLFPKEVFAKLEKLTLVGLPHLWSIHGSALPFSHLKEIRVTSCRNLGKLPLDSNSAKGHKIIVEGDESWWKDLQWEDKATQNIFLPCFKPSIRDINVEEI